MSSAYREKTWGDIFDAVRFAPIGWLAIVPGIALEKVAGLIETFAGAEPQPSPVGFLSRPARAVAKEVDEAGNIFARNDKLLYGAALTALVPACAIGAKAAAALGFSWAGNFGVSALAALGGAGAAVAVFPPVIFAVACAATLGISTFFCVKHHRDLFQSLREGINDTRQWRAGARPAPKASTKSPVAAPSPASETGRAFAALTEKMQATSSEERIRFMTSLRHKFPADFADAARLEAHAPELRKDITINRPLSFQQKRKSIWRPS